ncbi:MAG: cell division protein FtsX, partial [Bacteroidota bacterium]
LITKEQAAASMKEDLGDSSMLEDMPDLLRDVIRFNVKAEYLDTARLSEWRETLRSDTLVADLYFEAVNTGNVSNNLESLGLATLVLCLLLVFAAVALIHNTIRLDLYSNRFLIRNQELVGASWSFIGKPYIRRGLLNGLLSGLLAVFALSLMIVWLHSVVPELEELGDPNGILLVMTALVFLGMLISGLSTWFVVNRFLKMRIDDLY